MASYRLMTWRVVVLVVVVCACSGLLGGDAVAAVTELLLDGQNWSLSNGNASITVSSCSVPGQVHLDLYEAGLIDNPLYRFNEEKQSWIAFEDWSYSTSFEVSSTLLNSKNLHLIFMGLDTICTIKLNGDVLAETDNMFREWKIPVTDLLRAPPMKNDLILTFHSSVLYGIEAAKRYPYFLPSSDPIIHLEGRNFVRKAQSDFGWDWGPAFASAGIWKSIVLRGSERVLVEQLSLVEQEHHQHTIHLTMRVFLSNPLERGDTLQLILNTNTDRVVGCVVSAERQSLAQSVYDLSMEVPLYMVDLWWPIGYGRQPLYNISCQLSLGPEATHHNQHHLHTVQIGFRKVELIRERVSAEAGLSFFLRVNDVPIFVKGSNLVPVSVFHGPQDKSSLLSLLESCVSANFNMVRVWGGGVYAPSYVYKRADELGLMLWVEFAFACATYPRDSSFLHNIQQEVAEVTRIVSVHPSVVIVGANNENEIGMGWYEATRANLPLYIVDYAKLYIDTVRATALNQSRLFQFLISSPSNGFLSEDPFVLRFGDASSPLYGDVHFYDYENDCSDESIYPNARFVSEFGFQSLPSLRSWRKVSVEEDCSIDSDLLQFRQRHPDGNAQLLRQMELQVSLPKSIKHFNKFIYLSQVVQSICYNTAFEHWRRGRSSTGHTMGILYWQLNDVWVAPTWSSIEPDGTWKMLMYNVKRIFHNLSLSLHTIPGNNVEIVLSSDRLESSRGILVTQVWTWKGIILNEKRTEVEVAALSDAVISQFDITAIEFGLLPARDCFIFAEYIDVHQAESVSNQLFLTKLKHASLESKLLIHYSLKALSSSRLLLRFATDHPAPFLWLQTEIPGRFSNNGFLALPGKSYALEFLCNFALDSEEQLEKEFDSSLELQSIHADISMRRSRSAQDFNIQTAETRVAR